MMFPDNRRDSARSPLFMLVRSPAVPSGLFAHDVSLGGLQCRAKKALFPGTFLDLAFALPGTKDVLRAGGQVVTLDVDEQGTAAMGIRFCNPSPQLVRSVYRFLDRRRGLWEPPQPGAGPSSGHLLDLADMREPFRDIIEEALGTMRQASPKAAPTLAAPAPSLWRAITGVFARSI